MLCSPLPPDVLSLFFSFQTRGPTHACALLLFAKANFWIVHYCHTTHNDTLGWQWWRGTSKHSIHSRAGPDPSLRARGPATSISRGSGSWTPLREEEPVDSRWHLSALRCCWTPIAPYPRLVKKKKKKKRRKPPVPKLLEKNEAKKGEKWIRVFLPWHCTDSQEAAA